MPGTIRLLDPRSDPKIGHISAMRPNTTAFEGSILMDNLFSCRGLRDNVGYQHEGRDDEVRGFVIRRGTFNRLLAS